MPLGVAAKSYAQMVVVFNKLYYGYIKNKLMKSLKILKSASVLSGLNFIKNRFAQLESMIRS